MLFPACFQVGLDPLQAVRCNLLCLKPPSRGFFGSFFSTPSLSPHHSSKGHFLSFLSYLSQAPWSSGQDDVCPSSGGLQVSGWHGRDGRRSIQGLTIFQAVLFSVCISSPQMTQFMRPGARFVYLLVVEFTFPLLHKDAGADLMCQDFMFSWTLAIIAALIWRVWSKNDQAGPSCCIEQMLYYTTLVYSRPLRSVHQTWPWRLFSRRRFHKRLATNRLHCKRYKTACYFIRVVVYLSFPLHGDEMCRVKL